MKEVTGDLIKMALAGKFDVIVHGCNCFHTMGGGIAAQIKRQFPEAYTADLSTRNGSKEKLGTISLYHIKREVEGKPVKFYVVNGYTQFDFGTDKMNVDYTAVLEVFHTVKKKFHGLRIGYPMIGAGLAGGDWTVISKIIDKELKGEDHTLVVFQP